MRIAYIAPYQGPALLRQRSIIDNLTLAGRVKIELIVELLRGKSHEFEIISDGEVDSYKPRFYPSLEEKELFDPNVPVYYASALPVRLISGFWSSLRTLSLFKARHRCRPYDLVIIYNLKRPHITCARYAKQHLQLPVILEYEDDSFVDVAGREAEGFIAKYHRNQCRQALKAMSGCMAVSPYLLSQLPPAVPKLLLRGVVSRALINENHRTEASRNNWVVFSGTHEGTQGLEQMIRAWGMLALKDWELHIAGRGPITPALERLAENIPNIAFHGLLNRDKNARLLCAAKIGMNAQDVTKTPGNVFAFKIIEYLAAGLHVITTPRGALEPELEAGISYIADNSAETISAGLRKVIAGGLYERRARESAIQAYGSTAISEALNTLMSQAVEFNASKTTRRPGAPSETDILGQQTSLKI